MSPQDALQGRCLCGAVTVVARPGKDFITACNCENCRRWTGGVSFTVAVDETTARIDGPVRTIATMAHAERGFCETCGSAISWRVTAPGPMQGLLKLSAGLFADATGLPLGVEYYADQRPDAFDLSRPHEEMTTEAVNALLAAST